MNRGCTKKLVKLAWLTLLSIIITVVGNGRSIASSKPSKSAYQFMQCQSSLRHFSAHLETRKDDSHQAYYEDLYKQIQYFLKSVDDLPISPSQLVKCENLLKALQDIVGHHISKTELEPMPTNSNSNYGKLTKPALEMRRRPLPKQVHVRYVCEDPKKTRGNLKDAKNDELGELEPYPDPTAARLRKSSSSGEPKDIEK